MRDAPIWATEVFWLALGVLITIFTSMGGLVAAYFYSRGRADEQARNNKEALARLFKAQQDLEHDLHRSHETAERGQRIAVEVRKVLQDESRMLPSDTQVDVPNPLLQPLERPRPLSRPPPMPKKP